MNKTLALDPEFQSKLDLNPICRRLHFQLDGDDNLFNHLKQTFPNYGSLLYGAIKEQQLEIIDHDTIQCT